MIMVQDKNGLRLNEIDNVAIALSDLSLGDSVRVLSPQDGHSKARLDIVVLEPIKFGHKFSLEKISRGSKILKYGESIGRADQEIDIGDLVHIGNIKSEYM